MDAFAKLEQGMYTALEIYSNVYRGTGIKSLITTHIFEQARNIIITYLGLDKRKYVIIFSTGYGAEILKSRVNQKNFFCISSSDVRLPLGVTAIAVKRKALPKGPPFQTGGGTTRLVSPEWVIWNNPPGKYEAGTPAIINIIAFAMALQLISQFGKDAFKIIPDDQLTVDDILFNDEILKYSGRALLNELRQIRIGADLQVPTEKGYECYLNLDSAASTPTFMPVWNTVRQTLHNSGQVHQELIDTVRGICADMVGASLNNYEVIFTSNTTEAINLAAKNLSLDHMQESNPVVLSTILEHNSNDLPWRMIPDVSIIRLSVDGEGLIDLNQLDKLLCDYNSMKIHGKRRIRLMVVSGASNVLGIFNNLEKISRIVHNYGAYLLVDGAQMVAHRKINIEQCAIDYFAFSAHKVYAPFGTGVLISRRKLLKFHATELNRIKSSGEENLIGIAALGKALLLLQRIGLDVILNEEQDLTRKALLGLRTINNLRIYGVSDPDSPGFTCKGGVIVFDIRGILSNRVARELSWLRGIGVRSGCHCAHILIKHLVGVPPFLERFQGLIAILFPGIKFPGLVRVSFGLENTEKDIDALVQGLTDITGKKRNSLNRNMQQKIDDFIKTFANRIFVRI